jgi:L-2-hydroxyglutarate oxidase
MHDITIIGAGIVGLATAYKLNLARPGLRIVILDKENTVAAHQSSHNSGVIHSGIYYKPGSLKALNCRKGYAELLRFCRQYDIPHEVCGKVIVATKKEESVLLDNIYQRGIANGMTGIRKISAGELKEIEPYARGVEAIWVPQAGIISYKSVAEKYAQLLAESGATLILQAAVDGFAIKKSEAVTKTTQGDFSSRIVVNCAGLYADQVAKMSGQRLNVQVLPFRGEYYVLKKAKEYLVNNLIYPVPNPAFPFLGVHFTRMIQGGIEAGPNAVLAFRREGYSRWDFHAGECMETLAFKGFRRLAAKYWQVELDELHRSFSKRAFVKALQNLLPDIAYNDLERGGAGVRAQAVDDKGNLVDDYLILQNENFLNVINAPSPAATSSLAVGETIADIALKKLT